MTWTPEQQAKARPRIKAACGQAAEHFDKGDFDAFWLLAGMIAGGLDKLNIMPDKSRRIMELSKNDRLPVLITRGEAVKTIIEVGEQL